MAFIDTLKHPDIAPIDEAVIKSMPFEETITSYFAAEAGVGVWDRKSRTASHIAETLHNAIEEHDQSHNWVVIPPSLLNQMLDIAS